MLYITLMILLSIMITWTKNVLMSLLYSVMLYMNATCLLLLLGFEFLAIINILIYVGALAVLFLFVIMLIEIPTTELRAYYRGSSVLALISFLTVVGLSANRHVGAPFAFSATQESISQIGYALYLQYADLLILNSLVLTIALFGALNLSATRA